MFYYIYKITNTENGKIYVGVHKTKDLEDGYMGSGKVLKRAIEKYGLESFKKEIIELFDNSEEMYNAESQLVNEEFVKREDTYNLKVGGNGGFDYINENILNNSGRQQSKVSKETASKTMKKVVSENPEKFKKFYKECGERFRKLHSLHLIPYDNFKGKSHSEETKRKIGEANSKHQKGEGNSQFGTMWIHS
jgi:hypothetical protein